MEKDNIVETRDIQIIMGQSHHQSTNEQFQKPAPSTDETILNTEDFLAKVGICNPFTQYITFTMAFLWCLTAMSTMSPAFMSPSTSCEDNCTMVTVQKEFSLTKSAIDPGEMTGSIYFVGNLIFGQILCIAADRIGRRPVLVLSLILSGISGTIAAFATNFYILLLARLFQGSFFSAMTMVNWVLCCESIAFKGHGTASVLFGLLWVLGYCIVAPIALLLPNWRYIQLITSAPCLIIGVILYFTLPESISFLIAKARNAEARRWIALASQFTKRDYACDIDKMIAHEQAATPQENSVLDCIKNILSSFELKLYVCVQTVLWITDFMLYAGFSLTSTSVSAGNPFVSYIFSGLVELPCYILMPLALDHLGRKPTVIISHIITAIALTIMVFCNPEVHPNVYLSVWLIGKFGTASAFMCCFVYGAEIFPVQYRNICLGFCATIANIGAMVATHLSILDTIWPGLQFSLQAALCLICAGVTLLLPETKDGHGTPTSTHHVLEHF